MPDEQTQCLPPPAAEAKTVVVGVRPDQQSGDLLTWSLLNLAIPGDTIIALHAATHLTALLPTIKLLNSMIALYEAFCNLKQINLNLKVVRGSSSLSLLAREAKSLTASALVLGVADNGSTSVAKYCAKKLPASCGVFAVNVDGRVVFNRSNSSVSSTNVHSTMLTTEVGTGHNCPVCAQRSEGSTGSSPERFGISVVQCAMRIPRRYSAWMRTGSIMEELDSLRQKYVRVCRVFDYRELVLATASFSPDNIVGMGGSSCVYKGCLCDGMQVAVKILKHSANSLQEFVSEVEIITALRHKNIVSLVGFCYDGGNLMLVHHLLSRGSLEKVLHGEREVKDVLRWDERYKIAVGVAEALDYLHCGGNSHPVIHRDVKSSNILLPDDLEPQLCDFGIAQWASSKHISCRDVAGTFGYMAPENFMYGKVDEKVDVYAFGVVLLELISGRKPVTIQCLNSHESLALWSCDLSLHPDAFSGPGAASLHPNAASDAFSGPGAGIPLPHLPRQKKAKPILQDGKVKQLVDPRLGEEYDNYQMERMALAASLCLRRTSQSRPCIALILKILQGDDVLKRISSEIGGSSSEEFFGWDDEKTCPDSNMQSHTNLRLLDIEDEMASVSSVDHSVDYLQGR